MDDILGVLEEIQGNRQGENTVRFTLTASPLTDLIRSAFTDRHLRENHTRRYASMILFFLAKR